MESTLDAYADTYRRATAAAAALVQALSPAQFNWKPDPKSWSVAECLVHVNRGNAPYVPALDARLASGGPRGTGPFRYGRVAQWFIASTGPEPRRKAKTFAAMEPSRSGSAFAPDRVLADFRAINDQFLAVIERAEGLDVARVRIASPFFRWLRLPVGAFLEALAGHELRHLAQARRVTMHPRFPE